VGVSPVKINSSLLSAQQRNRLYWTNIKVEQPDDLGINLVDVLEENPGQESVLSAGRLRWLLSDKGQHCVEKRYASINPVKAACLTARSDASWNCNYIESNGVYRKLSCIEYERLQTLPDNYTKSIKTTERYRSIGNGWTVNVIAHILKGIK
jgi:site-specific DNA-cytosine methylase